MVAAVFTHPARHFVEHPGPLATHVYRRIAGQTAGYIFDCGAATTTTATTHGGCGQASKRDEQHRQRAIARTNQYPDKNQDSARERSATGQRYRRSTGRRTRRDSGRPTGRSARGNYRRSPSARADAGTLEAGAGITRYL